MGQPCKSPAKLQATYPLPPLLPLATRQRDLNSLGARTRFIIETPGHTPYMRFSRYVGCEHPSRRSAWFTSPAWGFAVSWRGNSGTWRTGRSQLSYEPLPDARRQPSRPASWSRVHPNNSASSRATESEGWLVPTSQWLTEALDTPTALASSCCVIRRSQRRPRSRSLNSDNSTPPKPFSLTYCEHAYYFSSHSVSCQQKTLLLESNFCVRITNLLNWEY